MSEREHRETVVDTLGPPESSASADSACLIVIHGEDLGRRLELSPGEPVVFGRAVDCLVVLEDETVSRRHASIAHARGSYRIEDLGSKNGLFVNDERSPSRALCDGDRLQIGRTIFKFLVGGNVESDYHEVIYQLMTNDGLTQAHNRRYFEQQLAREVTRAARYGRPLALVLFDVDHFKRVNDSFGHLGGDEALRQIAAAVRDHVRGEDLFARIGGEEFAVLVPEGTLPGALTLAERLRSTIEEAPLVVEGQPLGVTCSFGVGFLVPDAHSVPRDLVGPADAALYAAKAAGRNCVRS